MPMPFGLPPPDPALELFVASHGMSQGLSQTEGAQVIPRAYLRVGDVHAGLFWRNIDSPVATGILALFARVSRKHRATQLDLTALYRTRTGTHRTTGRHAWEFDATLRQGFGRLGLRLNAEFAPREFELGKSWFVEFGPSFQIAKGTSLFANVGRRERSGAPDYNSINVGVSRAVGGNIVLDARYHATDRSELGPRYAGRFVLSARLSL
ncbi:hypothetical protein [Sphingomonas sp.]|uniref:hypothetical protein n=1 Tax=Sphingomonas sp. TaxID=28214 RepID=UPI00389DFB6C